MQPTLVAGLTCSTRRIDAVHMLGPYDALLRLKALPVMTPLFTVAGV